MRDIIRSGDVPAHSPPLHAGTVNRRLSGSQIDDAPPLDRSTSDHPFRPA